MKPLCIDLFCGLGGWSEGFLANGYRCIGFDIQRHQYARLPIVSRTDENETVVVEMPPYRYPGQLVIQNALTLHGSQCKDAAVIVASPPCQAYSYLAMPWSRSKDPENSKAAKALRKKWETEGPDNRLFDTCLRIQREAIEAAGRYIPLIVENVRGAQPWVGKAKANFGSFFLWGDVAQVGNRVIAGRDLAEILAGRGQMGMGVAPQNSIKGFGGGWLENADTGAMNPSRNPREFLETQAGVKCGGAAGDDWFAHHNRDSMLDGTRGGVKFNPDGTAHPQGSWFRIADSSQGDRGGQKVPGFRFDGSGRSFQSASVAECGVKVPSEEGRRTDPGKGARFTSRDCGVEVHGTKIGGDWSSDPNSTCRKHGSRSNARKAASALIAKIPLALSEYIARMHLPVCAPGSE